jgi:hypothetical protein
MKNNISFRSGLEQLVAQQLNELGVNYTYEELKIHYTKPIEHSTYTPDFVLPNGIIIETKGQFVTSDRKKHKIIKEQFGDKYDIRFVFGNCNQTICKKSNTTYADWCNRFGFKYAEERIPPEWIRERR